MSFVFFFLALGHTNQCILEILKHMIKPLVLTLSLKLTFIYIQLWRLGLQRHTKEIWGLVPAFMGFTILLWREDMHRWELAAPSYTVISVPKWVGWWPKVSTAFGSTQTKYPKRMGETLLRMVKQYLSNKGQDLVCSCNKYLECLLCARQSSKC